MDDLSPDALLTRAAAEVMLALAGPDAVVRNDQLAAARALAVERRRALVVQATGWGKSAVYWIAARAIRDAGLGPTLVVSPLLSLMGNQVDAASRAGLRALTMNSGNVDDWGAAVRSINDDEVDVILVSPERLANPAFSRTVLTSLLPRLGLLVIDEAHCISSWGHDFRPDYQRIARLLAANPSLPVLATTATANARVTADVAAQLGDDTYVQRGQLARTSLQLSVIDSLAPIERYAWIDDALQQLSGSGIVYALTVAEVEKLTGFLLERGHNVASYTGQMTAEDRASVEKALRLNELKAVIATSALGMGYDKPDLAFCLHLGSPGSPVDYYQQIGRAGRALDTAVVALLPSSGDERIWEWFATSSVPKEDEAVAVLDAMAEIGSATTVPALEAATGVRRSRVELLLKILAVDDAVERTEDGWVRTSLAWTYDADKYRRLVEARRAEADLMRAYARGTTCLEIVLRRALDDEISAGETCGRCSVCCGSLPSGLTSRPSDDSLQAARTYLRGLDTIIEPRKMWAAKMSSRKGKISSDLAVEPGRALAFADDPAWTQVAELVADRTPDGPAPTWLIDALVAVLGRWNWAQRPSIVVPVPSTRKPLLIESVAQEIARVGRLDFVDALNVTGEPPVADLSPAARARAQETRLSLRDITFSGESILLIDDTLRTGWTATIAGALLRDAGASHVLPLVVHQRP